MIYPMDPSQIEEWCKKNDVEISLFKRQEKAYIKKFVRLSKGGMWVEYEYSPDIRQDVTTQAIRKMEDMMRARGEKI